MTLSPPPPLSHKNVRPVFGQQGKKMAQLPRLSNEKGQLGKIERLKVKVLYFW